MFHDDSLFDKSLIFLLRSVSVHIRCDPSSNDCFSLGEHIDSNLVNVALSPLSFNDLNNHNIAVACVTVWAVLFPLAVAAF